MTRVQRNQGFAILTSLTYDSNQGASDPQLKKTSGHMAEKQAATNAATKIRISQVKCDLQAGPVRFVAQLSDSATSSGVKAIWRNETGDAAYTGPQVSA